jgi:hypothetical protein
MANTTNFNWETPDDTDLVKDGAAAIRTLGSAIDTSLVDLKGGTTDQVLAKNSNTDMDFKWVTSDDANAIQNAIVDAKGDIIAASANDTPARLAVGTNDQRLVAASGEATGLKYVSDTQNTVIDAEGDLLVGDAADALQRLAIGTIGQVLTVDTAVDGKIKWSTPAGGGFVGCSIYKSSNQSISNGSGTVVTYNAEFYDTDAFHDNSTNNSRITIPAGKAGKYLITVTIIYAANATGIRIVGLLKNGDFTNGQQLINLDPPSSGTTRLTAATVMDLAEADYIQIETLQTSGGSLDLDSTYSDNVFTATYLGA